ncbi:hypothetical protein PF010_g28333 [Phytophthora fragariae]|nr:hypothetical protein PF010_g28333 [Phytophthora fragariae]
MLLTVYVDDLLLMGESSRCEAIARKLAATFELVELGPVKYLLGVEVSIDREKNTVFFSQTNYVEEILIPYARLSWCCDARGNHDGNC